MDILLGINQGKSRYNQAYLGHYVGTLAPAPVIRVWQSRYPGVLSIWQISTSRTRKVPEVQLDVLNFSADRCSSCCNEAAISQIMLPGIARDTTMLDRDLLKVESLMEDRSRSCCPVSWEKQSFEYLMVLGCGDGWSGLLHLIKNGLAKPSRYAMSWSCD